ncbi:reticulocyte-binding 2 A [Cryptosporidium xiaoi]|uniref:Reticulocyte-binding 2 A n=1 Tax=Cryptosporidium xiaoi TaxID=659607 RepID=A0AAV9Y0V1_9CRYT
MSSDESGLANQGVQLIDSGGSYKKSDYMDYVSHLQSSANQLRYENNVLKTDNANLVAKLDRAVSKNRSGVNVPENATTEEIAEAFRKLNEENCRLKREMERLIRSNTRYKLAMQNRDPSLMPSEDYNKNLVSNSADNGENLCQCEYILNEILETVSYKLETYEKHIWEHRLTTLTNERDEIAVQNISLVDRLAEIEAIIKVDHVLAERFNVPLEGSDEKNQILTLHRKLGFALDVNQQLERRLAFETQLSRSWQSNMHTIVSELRQYLYELSAVIKRTDGCEIFRTIGNKEIVNGVSNDNGKPLGGTGIQGGFRNADRESLKLLRLAKQRIEADTKRLETCNRRIIELENEVASLRVRNHSYIYREGAIDHGIASKEMMKSIMPPPKDNQSDLTVGLVNRLSKCHDHEKDDVQIMKNKNSVFASEVSSVGLDNIGRSSMLANENGLRYNLYRGRIEKLSGWLEDQVVCGHVFNKMKEIRNRRITDAMVIRPIKNDEKGNDCESNKKQIKSLGDDKDLGPMEIYMMQDAERRASQIIRRSGFVPASMDMLLRNNKPFLSLSPEKNMGQKTNSFKDKGDNNSNIVDTWLSSGMSPGDCQLEMPGEYDNWKTQRMLEMLAPDIRIRKNLLNESLNRIKPIPLENKENDNIEDVDENILAKNTECLFAPPLVMPSIKPNSSSRKTVSPSVKSPAKKPHSPVRIGIDMNEIAKVVVKQVNNNFESTFNDNKNEIGKMIDSLSDQIRILEDKTNKLMEESNSPKHCEMEKLKEIEEIVKGIKKNNDEKLILKQPQPPIVALKSEVIAQPPVLKPSLKNIATQKQHEKVIVKFSQYFLLFKKKILNSYSKLSLAFKDMEPNLDNEVTIQNFIRFLKKNKIPGSEVDHNKLFDELMEQNKVITKLSLYKKLHPIYEDCSEVKLTDFVKVLDELYEGCELPLLVSTFKNTILSKSTFVKFGQDQLGLSSLSMNKIWDNYMELTGDNDSNSEQLVRMIMDIRKELGIDEVEEKDINDKELETQCKKEIKTETNNSDNNNTNDNINIGNEVNNDLQVDITLNKVDSKIELEGAKIYTNKSDSREYKRLDSIREEKSHSQSLLSSLSSSRSSLSSVSSVSGSASDSSSVLSPSLEKNKDDIKTLDSNRDVKLNSDKNLNSNSNSSSNSHSNSVSSSDSDSDSDSGSNIKSKEEIKPLKSGNEIDSDDNTSSESENNSEISKNKESRKNSIVSLDESKNDNIGDVTNRKIGLKEEERKESLLSQSSSSSLSSSLSPLHEEELINEQNESSEIEKLIMQDPEKRAIYMNLNPETENLPLEDRLRKRIIEVYGTVGNGYKVMCGGDVKKMASISDFGDFIEGLNIYLSFSESKEFYNKIVNKKDNGLTVGLLYSFVYNLPQTTADPEIIFKHLKEIYGGVNEAFKLDNVYDQDTMNLDDFVRICKDSGYSNKSLGKLYGEMTGNVEGGLVEVQDVIQCIEGHITPKEVYKDESYRNSQWALWRVTPCRKLSLNPSIRKSEIDTVVDSLLSNMKVFKNIGKEELYNIVDTYFMREKLQSSSQIMNKNEDGYSLSVIITGGVDSIESLWYGENIIESYKAGDLLGLEMIEKKPSTKMLRTNSETILWKLTPEIWEKKVKTKTEELKDNFISIKDYYENDKIFSKLSNPKRKELLDNTTFTRYPSKTCIFKQGELAKDFMLVFDGSVSLKVDGDYSMIPENYRDKTPGTSIGDKYLFNELEYPYSCYCSSKSENVIIATISGSVINSILNEEVKKELVELESKYEKKFPIPVQSNVRFPDLKIVPKAGNMSPKVKIDKIKTNIEDSGNKNKSDDEKVDLENSKSEVSEDNDSNNNSKDENNIEEKSLNIKNINLEYLKSDIQSRILRKHMSLYECFNYIYEEYVSKENKEKFKNNPPISLFNEECQPSKEYIKKWPKYDKLFIGNWVDMDAFAEYVSEYLHINATFTDLTKIFEGLSEPLTDRLYIGTFYRNFEKISELSLRDFNRRLVEIDGGVYNTFTKLGGVVPGGSVSTDTFIVIGGRAGFTRPEATELFLKQLDILKSKTVSLSTLVKLVSSEITIKEAKELESSYGLFNMAQDYFGGGGETVSKLLCNSDGNIDYSKFKTKFENIVCEDEKLLSEIVKDENNMRLLDSFDYLEPIAVLNTNQRLWLLSLLEKKYVKKGNKFLNQGDPNAPLVMVYKGVVSIMQTGFFGYESKLEEIKIENKVRLYGWKEYYSSKQAIEVSLVAEKDSVVYLLSRKETDQLIEMINDRVEKIQNIYLILLKTPNIRDWPTNVLEIFSCCLKVEIYNNQDVILEMGPCNSKELKFYIIVKGEVSIQGIPIGDMEEISDYNIGKNRYFGEWSIINNFDERTSTVISNCDNTCLLSIPKSDFKRVLSLIGDYALHRFQDYGLQLYHFSPKHSKKFNSKIKVNPN